MVLFFLLLAIAPSDTLRLAQCYTNVRANAPARLQLALHDESVALALKNIDATFLPQFVVRAQGVYQSEVASFPFTIPGSPAVSVSHDQYKAALGVDQLVYDGGMTRVRGDLERARGALAKGEVDAALFGLYERVNALYSGILLLDVQQKSLALFDADLGARLDEMASRVRNGAAPESGLDVLRAERLKLFQQRSDLAAARKTALSVLATLTGTTIPEDTPLETPDFDLPTDAARRPEYRVFEHSRSVLQARDELVHRRERPTIAAFAESAIGRPPGLNVFENSLSPYWSVGIRLQWQPWDWHVRRREREAIQVENALIETREDAFTQAIELATAQHLGDMERLEDMLSQDEELIRLRTRIADRAAGEMAAGIITPSAYLIERNAAQQAVLSRDLHRTQLIQARLRYRFTLGMPQ